MAKKMPAPDCVWQPGPGQRSIRPANGHVPSDGLKERRQDLLGLPPRSAGQGRIAASLADEFLGIAVGVVEDGRRAAYLSSASSVGLNLSWPTVQASAVRSLRCSKTELRRPVSSDNYS